MALDDKVDEGSKETKILPLVKLCDIKGDYLSAVYGYGDGGEFLSGWICMDPYGECKGKNDDCPHFQELNSEYFEELSE